MKQLLTTLVAAGLLCLPATAQRITYTESADTEAITSIRIGDDPMEWLLATDGTQYAWVGQQHQWSRTYFDSDGDVTVSVSRRQDGDDVVETYTFTNVSERTVHLKNVGIYTHFNDNYPDAAVCMTSRCNAHIWTGGRSAYVCALRMNGQGPHLGLMVTEGEVTDYDVWERGPEKGMSNFRGVLALCPPDITLRAGRSYRLAWRLFVHHADDFDEQLQQRGGVVVQGRAHALLLGISSEQGLLERRVRFILDHLQMNDSNDPRYGAFMVYDNEGDSIVTNYMLVTEKEQPKVPVYITAGQSNADGRVPMDELPDYIRKNRYRYCQWSYGSGDFLRADGSFSPFWPRLGRTAVGDRWGFDAVVYYLLEQQLQQPFYIIKETMGGTAIDTLSTRSTHGLYWCADADWLSRNRSASRGGKSLAKALTDHIGRSLDSLAAHGLEADIRALIWHQGESDKTQADRYYDNLRTLIAYVRQYLVSKTGHAEYAHLPVVCGTYNSSSRDYSPVIVAALHRLAAEDPDFHVVDASDLSVQQDNLHFDAPGAEELGQRVYEKLAGNSLTIRTTDYY